MLRPVAQMIQLSYEPAFDAAHAMYRALRLCEGVLAGKRIPKTLFRLIDYYLLFPDRLEAIRLRNEHRRIRTIAKSERAAIYGSRPDDQTLFQRMETFSDVALAHLAEQGVLDGEALHEGWILRTSTSLPVELAARVRLANEADRVLLEALQVLINDYPFEGADGLKHRSGFLEYRYDAI